MFLTADNKDINRDFEKGGYFSSHVRGNLEISSCCGWFSGLNMSGHLYNVLGCFFMFITSQDGWLGSRLQMCIQGGRKKKTMVVLYIFYPKGKAFL